MRVPYETMYQEFLRVLLKYGMTPERAERSAQLFAEASLDGVYTHGLNRFPKFIKSVANGWVQINAEPVLTETSGIVERYDGQSGPGNLNADFCMDRAITLARHNTVGVVALRNTNHWMRPGAYGLKAAQAGCIGILWTNTTPNMPPWGGREAKLGNNPVVFALPHQDTPVVLDVAMSMFSYGKLESYARAGKQLPVEGGFDENGNLTKNAADVLKTHQPIPIGYWKGSGLSLMLDLVAASLAGGNTTRQIGNLPAETAISQVFMAIDLNRFSDRDKILENIHQTLLDLKEATPLREGNMVRYPGEGMAYTRQENTRLGIEVEESIWKEVCAL